MSGILERGRSALHYDEKKRHFYIKECNDDLRCEKENSNSLIMVNTIRYWPWCSKKLPENLSEKWYEILESEYGLDELYKKDREKYIPPAFLTDEWWKKRGL